MFQLLVTVRPVGGIGIVGIRITLARALCICGPAAMIPLVMLRMIAAPDSSRLRSGEVGSFGSEKGSTDLAALATSETAPATASAIDLIPSTRPCMRLTPALKKVETAEDSTVAAVLIATETALARRPRTLRAALTTALKAARAALRRAFRTERAAESIALNPEETAERAALTAVVTMLLIAFQTARATARIALKIAVATARITRKRVSATITIEPMIALTMLAAVRTTALIAFQTDEKIDP